MIRPRSACLCRRASATTALLLLAAPSAALAERPGTPPPGTPGALVASFGNSQPPRSPGLVLGPANSQFRAVAVQGDGKVLAAGQEGLDSSSRLIVARYTATGVLDASFGSGGITRAPATFSGAEAGATGSYAAGLAVRPDGRILVGGGLRRSGGSGAGMLVMRLNADGSADTSFDGDGIASALAGPDRAAVGSGLAADPDGRITVAGTARLPGGVEVNATTARWRTTGALDGGFGTNGIQQLAGIGRSSELGAAAATPDGHVVVAGSITDDFGASSSLMYRLNVDGTVDGSFSGGQFGGGGVWLTALSRNGAASSRLNAVAIAPSGQIVAGGTAGNLSSADSVVVRLGAGGAFDTTFGSGGVVRTPAASPQAQAARRPPPGTNGLVVRPGTVYAGGAVEADGVFRLLSLGALESAAGKPLAGFGAAVGPAYQGGLSFTAPFGTTYTFVNGASDTPYGGPMGQISALAGLPDGTGIVAAGVAAPSLGQGPPSSEQRGFIARYEGAAEQGTPGPDPTPGPGPGPDPTPGPGPGPGPAPVPAPTPASPPPGTAPTPQLPTTLAPASATKLEIARARILRAQRRLDVLAPISARASGAVRVAYRAAGRTEAFEAPIDVGNRRVRIDRRIPASQARLGTGILTITYRGDGDTQPQEVRLRAAARPAGLEAQRPRISAAGRLTAHGELTARAHGVVRLQVLYEPPAGATRTLQLTARIADGRYRFDERLPADVRAGIEGRRGAVHAYTLFTGALTGRIRGEMASHQVLGAR